MTAEEIRGYWHRKSGNDFTMTPKIRLSAEIAAQHAERNELLRESNRMQAESQEMWKQDAAERKSSMERLVAKSEQTIDGIGSEFHQKIAITRLADTLEEVARKIVQSTDNEFNLPQSLRMVKLVLNAIEATT